MASPLKKSAVSASPQAGRVSIINAVQTPLGFFTLGLLILEAGLLAISAIVPEQNRASLFWGCLILIFLTILVVGFLAFSRTEYFFGFSRSEKPLPDGSSEHASRYKAASLDYDVFLACPMAGFEDSEEYKDFRFRVLDVKRILKALCGVEKIYFPADEIPTMREFDQSFVATKVELDALRRSKIFIMIYPAEIISSVLFEAGYALGLGKLSLHFAKRDQLPFLLQELERLPRDFAQVRLYQSESIDDVISILRNNGRELLS
jgi:hypothetical protein